MDSNPICQPSPAKKMKCSFLDFVQFLMISQAGQWTQTPSATPLQPKKWNAHFWIMFNFWWLAGLVEGLEPHLPPLSTQKTEILIFRLRSTSDDWPGLSMDGNSHLPPLSSQKHEILLFGLRSTSDDQPRWSMDSNPILHLSPAKEMKCSFLYYVQLLMISWAGWWTRTPSTTPLQPKKWNAHFCITFNIWCWPDWSMDLNLIHHPSPAKKWNAHFWVILIMFNFWWLAIFGWSMDSNPIHHRSPAKKNEMLIFWLCSTSDDLPGWLMNLNPICHPSLTKKMKCSFLEYIQLLMISQAGQWTRTPSATSLLPKKWNAHFWIMFNFWWSAGLVDGLKPHLPPLSSQ